jgi:hypothetical protein
VFEELGDGFTLLQLGADEESVRQLQHSAERRNVPLKVVRDVTAVSRGFYRADLVLIRPDQFVAWTSGGGTFDASGIIDRAVGAPASVAY